MLHVIRRDELSPSPNRTLEFEGEPYKTIHAAGRMVTRWL
jgi:hypothetical protein